MYWIICRQYYTTTVSFVLVNLHLVMQSISKGDGKTYLTVYTLEWMNSILRCQSKANFLPPQHSGHQCTWKYTWSLFPSHSCSLFLHLLSLTLGKKLKKNLFIAQKKKNQQQKYKHNTQYTIWFTLWFTIYNMQYDLQYTIWYDYCYMFIGT